MTPNCITAYVVRHTSEGPRYLLIRRCSSYLPGTWQMVTGSIISGETAAQAALREIREETGLEPSALYSADAVETFYMQSYDKIAFVPVFVAFVEESKVLLSPSEHDACEWLSFEEAKKRLVWSEQKRIIAHVHESFVLNKPDDIHIAKLEPISHSTSTLSRTGVYAIASQNNQLLLVKQRKGPHLGKFDLPGGKMEAGETIETALRREIREETGMSFESMQFMTNITASTEAINDEGAPYLFHQIGLIYQIQGLIPASNGTPELEFFWLDPKQLQKESLSPILQQAVVWI